MKFHVNIKKHKIKSVSFTFCAFLMFTRNFIYFFMTDNVEFTEKLFNKSDISYSFIDH